MTLQIPSCYRLLIGLAFFLSAVVCLPASAGNQSVNQCPPATADDHAVNHGRSTRVKFADLDLNTEVGRRELLDRLSKAARRVCAHEASVRGDIFGHIYRSCYSDTLAAAVAEVHQEQVSALFVAMSRPTAR